MKQSSILLADCGLSKKWADHFPHRSLGLIYCQKYLHEKGVVVDLAPASSIGACLPFNPEDVTPFIVHTAASGYEFIGFSSTSDNLPVVLYLAEEIKRRQHGKQSLIVLGGIGPSSYPRKLLEHYPFLDVVVVGEGEETLYELVITGPHPGIWNDITGLVYRDSRGRIYETPRRERIAELHRLPLVYSEASYLIPGFVDERHSCFAVTSRGCTGGCLFCSHRLIWQGKVTAHSANQVVDLMETIQNHHPEAHLAFQDDDFLFSFIRLQQIAAGIKERSIRTPWAIFGRIDRATPEALLTLKQGGCSSIIFGLDAVTKQARERINKPWSFQEATPRLHQAREQIPHVEVNLIYGMPGESREEFHCMLREAYALRMDGFSVKMAPLAVYPNTPLHRLYSGNLDLVPNEKLFRPLLGEAYRYVAGHEELYPHFNGNRFDTDFQAKKRLLSLVGEALIVYDEI